MLGSAAQVFKYTTIYRLYKQIQHFHSTGVPKLCPGYGPVSLGLVNFDI